MADKDFSESSFARLINIAGRQRMLSQRVGFLSTVLTTACLRSQTPDPEQLDMLRKAAADFRHGYQVLLNGDPDDGLPRWSSETVEAVLGCRNATAGRTILERFMTDTDAAISLLSNGQSFSEAELSRFSVFVLTDVLQVLQAIVAALEEDFGREVAVRRERRMQEIDRVTAAVQEIQRASKFSKLIALNAKISANRAGPHGGEFRALTDEIKKISDDITESSGDILRYLEIA